MVVIPSLRNHTSLQTLGLLHFQSFRELHLCPPGCAEPLEVGMVLLLPSKLSHRCPAAHGATLEGSKEHPESSTPPGEGGKASGLRWKAAGNLLEVFKNSGSGTWGRGLTVKTMVVDSFWDLMDFEGFSNLNDSVERLQG